MLGLTAEEISIVLVGASLAVSTILGGRKGREALTKKPPASADMIEVAGAIVSDKAVERMVKSLDAFSSAAVLMTAAIERDVDAKGKLTAALIDNSRSLDRNSDVSEDMHDELTTASRHLERLKEEMIRGSPR